MEKIKRLVIFANKTRNLLILIGGSVAEVPYQRNYMSSFIKIIGSAKFGNDCGVD